MSVLRGRYCHNMDGICTAIGRQDGVLHLTLCDELEGPSRQIPLHVGDDLAVEPVSAKFCTGYRRPQDNEHVACPDQAQGLTRPQCDTCALSAVLKPCHRCTGEVCSNALRRDRCVVADNHVTYLASFGPGIVKIGVARWNRRVERLAEQGARAAIILARDDGQQVRRLETFVKRHIKVRQLTRDGLKDALIPDRLAPTTKLWAYTKRAVAQMDGESDEAHHARETEMLLQELERIASHEIRPRFDAKWTGEKDMVDLPRFALPAREPRLMSLRPHDRVRGTITSICGETIILNSDTGETVAMDAGSLVGYPLRSLTDSEHGEGQLSMSLF